MTALPSYLSPPEPNKEINNGVKAPFTSNSSGYEPEYVSTPIVYKPVSRLQPPYPPPAWKQRQQQEKRERASHLQIMEGTSVEKSTPVAPPFLQLLPNISVMDEPKVCRHDSQLALIEANNCLLIASEDTQDGFQPHEVLPYVDIVLRTALSLRRQLKQEQKQLDARRSKSLNQTDASFGHFENDL